MFLGAGEIVVVLVVALMVLGPKKMPEVARKLAKFMGQVRRLTDEVRGQVDDALREPHPEPKRQDGCAAHHQLPQASASQPAPPSSHPEAHSDD